MKKCNHIPPLIVSHAECIEQKGDLSIMEALDFESLIGALAKFLKTTIPITDNEARIGLDDLVFEFKYDVNTSRILGDVALLDLPQDLAMKKRIPLLKEIYQTLLQKQYCFCESGGFIFGVDPSATVVSLKMMLDSTLTEELFISAIERFYQVATIWSQKLQKQLAELKQMKKEPSASDTEPEANVLRI